MSNCSDGDVRDADTLVVACSKRMSAMFDAQDGTSHEDLFKVADGVEKAKMARFRRWAAFDFVSGWWINQECSLNGRNLECWHRRDLIYRHEEPLSPIFVLMPFQI